MINALDVSNYFSFNISAAQILGINNAIYCSELINIYNKAKKKKKLYDEFFLLNRNYVAHRTTLDIATQYECDASLNKVGLVEIKEDNSDMIKFNYEKFVQIVAGDDSKFLKDVSKKARALSSSEVKEAKKKRIMQSLQEKVDSGNANIDIALRHWIEVTNEKTFMSCDTVLDFQKVLMQYAKVDVKKALRVVEIATSQAWTSCTQAISSYEKEQEVLTKVLNQPRVSKLKRGSTTKLSDEIF